jgi:hypothetical protein
MENAALPDDALLPRQASSFTPSIDPDQLLLKQFFEHDRLEPY